MNSHVIIDANNDCGAVIDPLNCCLTVDIWTHCQYSFLKSCYGDHLDYAQHDGDTLLIQIILLSVTFVRFFLNIPLNIWPFHQHRNLLYFSFYGGSFSFINVLYVKLPSRDSTFRNLCH